MGRGEREGAVSFGASGSHVSCRLVGNVDVKPVPASPMSGSGPHILGLFRSVFSRDGRWKALNKAESQPEGRHPGNNVKKQFLPSMLPRRASSIFLLFVFRPDLRKEWTAQAGRWGTWTAVGYPQTKDRDDIIHPPCQRLGDG